MQVNKDKTHASGNVLEMTSLIVSSFVSCNSIPVSDLPGLIQSVYASLLALSAPAVIVEERPAPAVPIEASITPDHIICLEDGRELKMLKRYLRSHYGMTPEDYRTRWDLPADYPMVAPNYAKRRSAFAKESGLGRKRPVKSKST